MSRYRSGTSKNHAIRRSGNDYELSWVVDYYYPDSRLRFPRAFRRWTDRAGAERFAKRWKIPVPQ